jgi:A/G-specific adenine glycosylase
MKRLSISDNIPSQREISLFRRKLLRWFDRNGRRYPWRETQDPFRILIAEMMLRRTRADQVKAVYEQLFSEYPDVKTLANAEDKRIKEILYPLGLRWRNPAFILVAREIEEKYGGRVPDARDELTKLPGVGEYVAGAVLSVGYGKKEWMVDSNVVRVFRRYFGIRTSTEGRRDKHIIEMAKRYVICKDPRRTNLSILDFAALVCTTRNPACKKCPLKRRCKYINF